MTERALAQFLKTLEKTCKAMLRELRNGEEQVRVPSLGSHPLQSSSVASPHRRFTFSQFRRLAFIWSTVLAAMYIIDPVVQL